MVLWSSGLGPAMRVYRGVCKKISGRFYGEFMVLGGYR